MCVCICDFIKSSEEEASLAVDEQSKKITVINGYWIVYKTSTILRIKKDNEIYCDADC